MLFAFAQGFSARFSVAQTEPGQRAGRAALQDAARPPRGPQRSLPRVPL